MDDRCGYCSGLGDIPGPGTGDTHRIVCPKCDGAGRPRVVLVLGTMRLQEALVQLQTALRGPAENVKPPQRRSAHFADNWDVRDVHEAEVDALLAAHPMEGSGSTGVLNRQQKRKKR